MQLKRNSYSIGLNENKIWLWSTQAFLFYLQSRPKEIFWENLYPQAEKG